MKATVTSLGDTFTARDAAGNILAVATFAMPRRPEDCAFVMRERALWLRRWK